ncbi:hypothetical protein [Aureibacillus halotolerans]|nr:hypothetical protein [Aureibacillus halotolerans]
MELTASHWMYLVGTLVIIMTMLFRQNVVVPAIIMTFFVGWTYLGSFFEGLQTVFYASLVAAGELFNIFLIIAIMTALLNALQKMGSDELMIVPFQRVMKNGHLSFWVLAMVTYVISLFFWPTPAVPLVGALLIPVAVRAGLPPIGTGIAISLAGQGMALSSDYIIQIAPMLTATAAATEMTPVADRSFVLSIITGGIALLLAYLSLRKYITAPIQQSASDVDKQKAERKPIKKMAASYAIIVPLAFLGIVVYMVIAKFTGLVDSIEGGAGAALIGGTALFILIALSASTDWKSMFSSVSDHLVDGFVFAFRAMAPVLPIAGFFFIGSGDQAAAVLSLSEGATAPSFLFELVEAGQNYIPNNAFMAGFGILIVGMLTGLDGSGFSGLPLVGALSGALGPTVGVDVATLGAIGQMGSVWVGGGTLIAWSSLVAVAGFANVPVMELVRKSFLPVMAGLIISTLFGLYFF